MNCLLQLWSRARSILFSVLAMAAFATGLLVVGPFVSSPAYKWMAYDIEQNPLIGELLNFEGMLLEKLISTTVPFFLVWSLVLLVYGATKGVKEAAISRVGPVLSMFTGGAGALIALWGSVLLGLSVFGLMHHRNALAVITFSVIGLVLFVCGFVLKSYAHPRVVDRPWLRNHACVIGVVLGLLGVCAFLYGIVAKPIQLFMLITDAYHGR